MPLPIWVVPCPLLSNFARKFQPKAPDPKPHSFMADINSTFVQNIFNLAIAERISHIKHHCQADNFRRSFKLFEQVFVDHSQKLWGLIRSAKFFWQHQSFGIELNRTTFQTREGPKQLDSSEKVYAWSEDLLSSLTIQLLRRINL